MYGTKPYDKHIMPVENLSVAIAAMGEGKKLHELKLIILFCIVFLFILIL